MEQAILTKFQLKKALWSKLKVIYQKHISSHWGQISEKQIPGFVDQLFGKDASNHKSYFIQNFRLIDQNLNGSISYEQMGKFLFGRYLGPKTFVDYRNGKGSNTQIKINQNQFSEVLNKSFACLKVKLHRSLSDQIFEQTDKDQDRLITFRQYISFLKNQFNHQFNQNQGIKKSLIKSPLNRPSKIKEIIWGSLKQLYRSYIDHDLKPKKIDQIVNLESTIKLMFKHLPQDSSQIIWLNSQLRSQKQIDYKFLSKHFIKVLASQKWNKFWDTHKQFLNKQEFIFLFNKTFSFLIKGRLKNQYLSKLFNAIDINKDKMIQKLEYTKFIRQFLAKQVYQGVDYRFQQDLPSNEYQLFQSFQEIKFIRQKSLQQNPQDKFEGQKSIKKFYKILLQEFKIQANFFDYNQNGLFQMSQIQQIVKNIFDFTEQQIQKILTRFKVYSSKRKEFSFNYLEVFQITFQTALSSILIKRFKNLQKQSQEINIDKIIDLISQFCSNSLIPIKRQDIKNAFQSNFSENKNIIPLTQYEEFISKYFGYKAPPNSYKKSNQNNQFSKQEIQLAKQLKTQLQLFFQEYDVQKKGYLTLQQLESFAYKVLQIKNDHWSFLQQQYYVIMALYMSINKSYQLTKQEFIKFIIITQPQHALIELARQKNIKQKDILIQSELNSILQSCSKLMRSKPQKEWKLIEKAANAFQSRAKNNNSLLYNQMFRGWKYDLATMKFE